MSKILLLILLSLGLTSFGQNRTSAYDFPVKPGTEEWKKLQSRDEMAATLIIPSDILKDLTTEALAETCLNFPMFKDLYFFNDVQTGFNTLNLSFNGFRELINRGDAGVILLNRYKQMSPSNINSKWNDALKGDFTFQFVQIEMLLAQPQIINSLREDTRNELLNEAVLKYESKKKSNGFSGFALSPSILIIGRILDKENKLQSLKAGSISRSIQKFLLSGTADNPGILDQIWRVSKN